MVSYGLTSFMVIICNALLVLPLHRPALNSLINWTKACIYGAGATLDGLLVHSLQPRSHMIFPVLFWTHLFVNMAAYLPYTFI